MPLQSCSPGLCPCSPQSSTNPEHLPTELRHVWGGSPNTDTLWDEPPAQSTGLWSNVAFPELSATSPGTTGSSKTTEEALITGTCASKCCLHTGQEVKGYGMSGSRAPAQTLLLCKVSSPELCFCCMVPKSQQQQQITALWDHRIV